MALSPAQVIQQAVLGLTADASTSPVNGNTQAQCVAAATQMAQRRSISVPGVTDGGTAGSAFGETVCFVAQTACVVRAVNVAPGVAITANNSTYATFLVQKRTALVPGTPVTVATQTTQITDPVFGANAVAFKQYALTLSSTLANLTLAAGDVLTITVTKASTGVAVGAAATATGAYVGVTLTIEEQ